MKRASSLEEKDDRYKSDSSSDSDSEMQPDLTISGNQTTRAVAGVIIHEE